MVSKFGFVEVKCLVRKNWLRTLHKTKKVDVETKGEFTRGMTVCDWRDFMGTDPEQEISREKCWNKYKTSGNVEVAMEFDQKRFREVLFDTVRSYKEMN